MVKKGVYSGGRVRFWKGCISKGGGRGTLGRRGSFFIVVEKGSIFWKEGIYYGRLYVKESRPSPILWEGYIYSLFWEGSM